MNRIVIWQSLPCFPLHWRCNYLYTTSYPMQYELLTWSASANSIRCHHGLDLIPLFQNLSYWFTHNSYTCSYGLKEILHACAYYWISYHCFWEKIIDSPQFRYGISYIHLRAEPSFACSLCTFGLVLCIIVKLGSSSFRRNRFIICRSACSVWKLSVLGMRLTCIRVVCVCGRSSAGYVCCGCSCCRSRP